MSGYKLYFFSIITKSEVNKVFKMMKLRRAIGVDRISIEISWYLGEMGVRYLTNLNTMKFDKLKDVEGVEE